MATFDAGGGAALVYGLFRLGGDGWHAVDAAPRWASVPRFVTEGELWRLLTAGLLHDQLLAVGLNAAVLLSRVSDGASARQWAVSAAGGGEPARRIAVRGDSDAAADDSTQSWLRAGAVWHRRCACCAVGS